MLAPPDMHLGAPLTEADVSVLRDKYERLLALRHSRQALEILGTFQLHGEAQRLRHLELAELAHRFPGALAELEALSVVQMEGRLQELTRWRGGEPGALWMRLVRDYHGSWREYLARPTPRGPARRQIIASLATVYGLDAQGVRDELW